MKRSICVMKLAALAIGFASVAAAQATATVAGTVSDVQGAVIPGASISLVSETRGTVFDAKTGATGDFVITNIPGDTYTVRATMTGFRQAERRGVLVVPGDRIAVGTITLEVGGGTQTVEVSAQAPLLQTQTGERSSTITQQAVEAVPTYTTGTFFAQAVSLAPGVTATASNAPTRLDSVASGGTAATTARTNYMLDGVTDVNTGGNQPGISLNYDSIAEVKVLTNTYSAEYGRSSGLQVVGITKSGTNQFHGSAYDIENRSAWATNAWVNQRNGVPKTLNNQRFWGGTLGGPVGKPGRDNRKLFFFVSEQLQPTTIGGKVNFFRVPTALERQGDFSQSTDNNGNLFNTIADPASGLPCTTANHSGCFQDGGVLGKISPSRLYQLGLNILNQYPLPNAQGLNYNLKTVAPAVTTTNYQHVARADYNVSTKLRISAKFAGQNTSITPVAGSIPGFNDRVTEFPALIVPSATVVYIVNASTVIEGSYGYTRGDQLGTVPVDAAANRCNVGLCNFPELFPDSLNIIKGSYQDKVLSAMKAPWYVNGQALLQPDYTWGTRVANPPPNNNYPPFLNWQYTHDANIAVTKVWGVHTFKVGFVMQNSVKVQNLGTITTGTLPTEGALAFDNNSNNPLDTGFGFANAALGVFSSYGQQGPNPLEGRYVYHDRDFYIQDNWKLNGRLTLDLGIRLSHSGPQYDSREQESNFFPNLWSLSDAPYLFTPGCGITVAAGATCPGVDRVAINPLTGASMGPGSSGIIGDIVPNSGNPLDGIVQAGHGISKTNYTQPFLAAAPRIGVAYSPFRAQQRLVIRGGIGLFFDRPQGDAVFGQIGNPPVAQEVTVYNSTLQQVASGTASAYQPPPSLTLYNYNSKLPSSFQYNLGTQMVLPWSSSLDVSWVGADNYNSIAYGPIGTPTGQLPMDLNAPDVGTAYLPQYQDPTLGTSSVPGATALTTNLLRPYRGLASITSSWPRFNSHYDSIQTAFNRRYRDGVLLGFNYTLGLRNSGNMLSPPHLTHLSDGTFQFSSDQSQLDSMISDDGLRRHTIKAYGVWQLPHVHGAKPVTAVTNGWQLSGAFTAGTGPTYDATYTYNNNGANVNLTGSPSYAARIRVVGNPGSGCSGNAYGEFNAAAFTGPTYGSKGNESGSSLLHGCFDHTVNLSISRYFRLGSESRQLQIRADAFNVFNAVVINTVQNQLTLASPSSPTTILNNQYNADGTLNQARLTAATAGFGAATGAQNMRTLQLEAKFIF